MIRKAQINDLEEVLALARACAASMNALGIYHWDKHYPTKAHFEKDIQLQELYVLEKDKILTGIIVLTNTMGEEYTNVQWLTNNVDNLYIHRLAIHPEYWGQGYAQILMKFAEDYARQKRFQSVRLDTFSQNKRNQIFFKKRGYTQLGNIFFPKQSEYPFHCYELVL